ncbi:hypothetical protein J2S28_001645 [Rhizobium sp. SLBN-94]|nr:hypothetical protein [Rhizobium sp. SLBN-94]
MSDILRVCYALTAAAFAVVFLAAVIIYGGDTARNVAIGAAFLGCASQFTGQDTRTWKASLYLAYGAFIVGLFAYLCLLLGK